MPNQPNILFIQCDQLSAQALKAYGNTGSTTPNIDGIFDAGVRFRNAYTSCPLCQPARAALWTGRYAHRTGVTSNGGVNDNLASPETVAAVNDACAKDGRHEVPLVPGTVPTVGSVFSAAGYRCIHFGKRHDAGSLHGFELAPEASKEIDDATAAWPVNYDTERDRNTREQTVSFLNDYDSDTPYFAVADLQNPHNICGWIGEFRDGTPPVFPKGDLPPLPTNALADEENFKTLPLPVQYICCAHNRQGQMGAWDEEKIRLYLAAYYHYTARVDAEIGRILAAMRARGDADNTLVVFTADHGDGMGGRWMGTKHTSFYDETTRIPLVFSGPGIDGAGRDVDGLASNLDLFPTLCAYAGISAPDGLDGMSLHSVLMGDSGPVPREAVLSEWYTEWGGTYEPGRMVRTERFKYTRYMEGDGEELYDLETDPHEMRNLAPDAAYAGELDRHRKLLDEYTNRTDDPFFELEWKADPRWRSHEPGYRNHRGPAAPEAADLEAQ